MWPPAFGGDLQAMIGSTRIGAERLQGLVKDVGAARLRASFDAILAHAESLMRRSISALPDGVYLGEDCSNTDSFAEVEVPVRVKVTVQSDTVIVDSSGSAAQVKGFKNSSLANTYSAVYVALLAFFDSAQPKNAGAFRLIRIIAPEGTVVNALAPAAMTYNTVYPATEIVYAIWKALGQALPQRACAGWGKASHCVSAGPRADGTTYVMYHMHAYPGAGAVQGRDGFNTLGTVITLGGMSLPNVEAYEKKYPVRIVRQEFRVDGAGAGQYRGGTGTDYEVLMLESGEVSFRGEGLRTVSGFGIAGGLDGAVSTLAVEDLHGVPIETPQYGVRQLPPCHISISSSGGGGWGRAAERDRAHVLRDWRDGVISADAASRVYGMSVT